MKTRIAIIRTGVNRNADSDQEFVEIQTERRRYWLQKSQEYYYIGAEMNKDEETYLHEGPFNYHDGLSQLLLIVMREEKIAPPNTGSNGRANSDPSKSVKS